MAQCWIVGGGGVGRAVSPQRFPRLLATGCALHDASLSRVWPRERHQREVRSGLGLVTCSPRFPRRVVAGCALHGASLSLAWPRESNQREGHPDIRVSLREPDSLRSPFGPACGCYFASLRFPPPVPLRGPAYKGRRGPLSLARHPCLAFPSTTPALGLLTGTVARSHLSYSARHRVATGFSKSAFDISHGLAGWDRVPSGGRVESTCKGIGGRDAAKGVKGLGCPLYASPWNGDGAREV